ncbi:MAG: hypothetical protein IJA72_02310 [Clostridia bacterium]|nr:hypothetical protein [Clostridia bacterium]
MHKQGYKAMAGINLLLGLGAIFLYLPYMLQAFNIDATKLIKVGVDLFEKNYFDVLIVYGIILLVWIVGLTILSFLSHPNVPKLILKVAVLSALALPLMYVLALKYDWAIEFWIKNINENIKMISYILIIVSSGSFVLGVIFNFSKKHKANIHQIIQALVMCVLVILFVAVQGWCGWKIDIDLLTKLYGVLMGLFAIYLPLSVITLLISSKQRV